LSSASVARWPGGTRRLTFARALGNSVLDASATLGASMPMTVIEGCDQMRDVIDPEPRYATPSSTPDSARSRSSG
jgi:hypothetical protein